MSTSKERKNAIKKLKAFAFNQKIEISDFREKIDESFSSVFLPNNVALSEKDYGGVPCDVLKPPLFSKNRILLYVHGGAFVAGSRKAYRPFVSSLANAVSCMAIVPEFKLAPSHPFPYALEDVQNVFRILYAEEQFKNGVPEIIIAADSSGAAIASALILSLRDKFRASIRQVIFFSPWLDLSDSTGILSEKKSQDEIFRSDSIKLVVENYVDSSKLTNPLVSPVHAKRESLLGFPPVFIQCGENEMFLEASKRFRTILSEVGVKCEIDIWENMMPLFQLVDDCLDESHLAIEKIGKMITDQDHSNESEYNIGLPLEK